MMLARKLVFFLAAGVVQIAAFAQNLADVAVSNVVWKDTGLQFDLRSGAMKPIAGYAIRARYLDAAGKMIHLDDFLNVTNAIIPSSPRKPFAPGESWHVSRALPVLKNAQGETLRIADIQLSVDVVVFTDGTTAGPNKARKAETIAAMASGAQFERQAGAAKK